MRTFVQLVGIMVSSALVGYGVFFAVSGKADRAGASVALGLLGIVLCILSAIEQMLEKS